MKIIAEFEARLPSGLRKTFRSLTVPAAIQSYLDTLPYVGEERDRCPVDVMKDGQCHCLDGGLMAALALRRIGYPGLLIDLVPAHDALGRKLDDDHVLAVFRHHGAWGAIAKSNYTGLRYREPVYRTLRELAMSYFDDFFNTDRQKTLRGYTRPLNIASFDRTGFAWDEGDAAKLYRRLYERKTIALISRTAERHLQLLDQRSFEAGTLGLDLNWAYRPPEPTR